MRSTEDLLPAVPQGAKRRALARDSYDVVILGSGGSALTAAVTARYHGQSVLVLEKRDRIGGTTAMSGGQIWIPANRHAARAGIVDSPELAREYIRHEAGNDYDPVRVEAFLFHAPRMLDFLESHTHVRYTDAGLHSPDYDTRVQGALPGGRSLIPASYNARRLGKWLSLLGPKAWWTDVMGVQVGFVDRLKFANALREWDSAAYVGRRLARQIVDKTLYGRSMTLHDGNALVAALLQSAIDAGVDLQTSSPARTLVTEGKRVAGVRYEHEGQLHMVLARRGVILATGGFSHDPVRRAQLFAHVVAGSEHLSAAADGNTGDGLRMAEAVGGQLYSLEGGNNAAWVPVVRSPSHPAPTGHIPVFWRGGPGIIAVMASGRRFANEAAPYHDFMQAMFCAARKDGQTNVVGHLICDHRTLRRYGLGAGAVRPFPFPWRRHIASGLLTSAPTLAKLAERIGVPPRELEMTVAHANEFARTGKDAEFSRGESPYDRTIGDPEHDGPNSCLGSIEHAPFHAMRFVAGEIATFAGIRADQHARALDAAGQPIPGLYAVGNDMGTALGGDYPGRGGTLGPGMTFAYIAGLHVAGALLDTKPWSTAL